MGKLSARKKRVKRTVEIGTVDPAAGSKLWQRIWMLESRRSSCWSLSDWRRWPKSCRGRSWNWPGAGINARSQISRTVAGALSGDRYIRVIRRYP